MSFTPREIVRQCLQFEHPPRLPRHMWTLPWGLLHFPEELAAIERRFPNDLVDAPNVYRPSPHVQGDPYVVGSYTDPWGCVFENLQEGVIGEVRKPILGDISDWQSIQPPYDILPEDTDAARDQINRYCAETDRFVLTACNPRPWERYQFLRGTVEAMMDIVSLESASAGLLRKLHEFFLTELEFWVTTDVDAITFMDDWGSQQSLLISPALWREWFKPLYRDYCSLAHAHGKFAFMHSDGNIEAIYEDLADVGVDAINSQLFTMNMAELGRRVKGRITFWGEIDRQQVLPSKDPQAGRDAVREVARHLYDPAGGVIAQFEFGLGANPTTASAIFDEWERLHEAHWKKGTGPFCAKHASSRSGKRVLSPFPRNGSP